MNKAWSCGKCRNSRVLVEKGDIWGFRDLERSKGFEGWLKRRVWSKSVGLSEYRVWDWEGRERNS